MESLAGLYHALLKVWVCARRHWERLCAPAGKPMQGGSECRLWQQQQESPTAAVCQDSLLVRAAAALLIAVAGGRLRRGRPAMRAGASAAVRPCAHLDAKLIAQFPWPDKMQAACSGPAPLPSYRGTNVQRPAPL